LVTSKRAGRVLRVTKSPQDVRKQEKNATGITLIYWESSKGGGGGGGGLRKRVKRCIKVRESRKIRAGRGERHL